MEAGWRRDAMLSHGDKLLNTLMGRFIAMSQDLTLSTSPIIKAGENMYQGLDETRNARHFVNI